MDIQIVPENQVVDGQFVALPPGTVLLQKREFEDLVDNLSELLRWVEDAKVQLTYYREEITDGS